MPQLPLLCHNRPGETKNRTNFHLELHECWINYVNADVPPGKKLCP